MSRTILVTGASSGFGELTAYQLADAGNVVYASMRGLTARNAAKAEQARAYAVGHGVDPRTLELDVQDQDSVDAAVARFIPEQGRIDVIVHNAGHMSFGPAEAFTPKQCASLYDINVVGPQRRNRAALPHMRRARQALLIWVGSTSTRGRTPLYIAPISRPGRRWTRLPSAMPGNWRVGASRR